MIRFLLLGASALIAPAVAAAEWREAETAHFRIISGGTEKQLSDFARRLESVDALMRKATRAEDDEAVNKVRVYLVNSVDDVQRAVNATGSGIGGFYTVNEHGPFAVVPRKTTNEFGNFTPEVVLFHEYGHHFQLQYFPITYPGWYVEGSAELFSTVGFRPDGKLVYGRAASHRGQSLAYAKWVPVSVMLTKTADDYPDDADFYGQAWLLTHYLTFSPARSGQLKQYLGAIASGQSPTEAAKAFGNLNTLSSEVRKYFEAANFPMRLVPMELPAQVVLKTRVLSPGETALIPETIAYRDYALDELEKDKDRTKERGERGQLLERVRRKAARFGNDAFALRMLADVEFVTGNYAQSRSAADRLLAIAPNDVGGLYRKATLLIEDAEKASGAERKRLALEGREFARRAAVLDQNDPQPFVAFYRSFPAAGQAPTRNAIDGLEQAVRIVPQDDGPRWMLVQAFAATKRYDEAIRAIGPIAFAPHKSPSRERALKRLEELKKAKAGSASPA